MMNERFPFSVAVEGDEAFVSMDLGGIVRMRNMPSGFLEIMSEATEQSMKLMDGELTKEGIHVADTPKWTLITGGDLGPCIVRGGASRLENGEIERSVAFYDKGEPDAPVLVLIEEQMNEFIQEIERILLLKGA